MSHLTDIAFESAESASPVITRLIGGLLAGRHETVFQFKSWERLGMRLLNQLPPGIGRSVVRWQFYRSALPPARAASITMEQLISQRLADYHHLEGPFPVVVVGSALAGAAAHLAGVLGGPFLPQPFILGLRGGSPADDLDAHFRTTSGVAAAILARNPGLKAIGHFDPVHDGWLTRTISHLRLKLIELPEQYKTFIGRVLEPGGTIIYLDCQAQWYQFPIEERFSYQVGGWGGISPREYIEGSDRIDRYLEMVRSPHRGGWGFPNLEPDLAPESEWGNAAGLQEPLGHFAQANGYRFLPLSYPHPHDYSRLALQAHKKLFQKTGQPIRGILIEPFTQYAPHTVLDAGLLPLWLVFNTDDSLVFMQEMLGELSPGLPIFFSGLTTLSRTPDMVPWSAWVDAFSGRRWHSIGAGPRRFPEDLVALFEWERRLRAHLGPQGDAPLPTLPITDFLHLIESSTVT